MKVTPYWNSDKTAYGVLVSYGYGAGWSTWGPRELAYDSRVIKFWKSHKDDKEFMRNINFYGIGELKESEAHKEANEFFKSLGYDEVYFGGFNSLELEWVPRDSRWRIEEYDGAESLVFENEYDWVSF